MRLVTVLFVTAFLLACNSQTSTSAKNQRDCDDLKGSSKIMAMNCKK